MSIARNRLTSDDAFRMSQRHVMLDTSFRTPGQYGPPNETHGTLTATGGSVQNIATPVLGLQLAVTSSEGSRALVQTHHAYGPGRSTQVLTHSNPGVESQVRRWGRFDRWSGFFFQLSGTTLSIVWRSNRTQTPVDVAYPQIAWSDDRADGSRALPVLDLATQHAYSVEIPPGGAGVVRFYIDNVLVHALDTSEGPSVDTCVLPGAFEVVNAGTTSAGALTVQGEQIATDDAPVSVSYSLDIPEFTAGALPGTFIGIRPRELSPINRVRIAPRELGLAAIGGDISVYIGAGITAATSYDEIDGSLVETCNTTEDLSAFARRFATVLIPDGEMRVIDLTAMLGEIGVREYFTGAEINFRVQATFQIVGSGAQVSGYLAWNEVQP